MSSPKRVALKAMLLFSLPLLFLFLFSFGCSSGSSPQNQSSQTKSSQGEEANPLHSADKKNPAKTNPSAEQLLAKDDIALVHQSHKPVSSRQKPLFDQWGKPQLAILLTGEQHGYFEPCGCSSNQLGGMARRADLVRKMKEKGWVVTGLDLGGTVKRARRQSQMKFETTLAALKDMNYAAMALGPEELRFGPEYLLSQHVYDKKNPKKEIPFLSANVTLYEADDLGTPIRYRMLNIAGLKIGITSILGKSYAHKVSVKEIAIKEPAKVLPGIIQLMQKEKPTTMILLSHANLKETKALAKKFPEFQIILSGGGPEDPSNKIIQEGKTWILNVGRKGKHVGVLGLFPNDKKNPFRFELVTLDEKRFTDQKVMVEHMRDYQERLKDEKLAYKELPIAHPTGAKFVGAEACGDCHSKAFKVWEKTAHAKAFESLKHPRKGMPDHKITRIYDPECLSCHVNGWNPQNVLRYKSGFINKEFAQGVQEKERFQLMQGQQCEGCHGPGSRHIQLINDDQIEKAAKEVRVTLKMAKEKICAECHDLDNSPKFEFESYWKKVKHKGLD